MAIGRPVYTSFYKIVIIKISKEFYWEVMCVERKSLVFGVGSWLKPPAPPAGLQTGIGLFNYVRVIITALLNIKTPSFSNIKRRLQFNIIIAGNSNVIRLTNKPGLILHNGEGISLKSCGRIRLHNGKIIRLTNKLGLRLSNDKRIRFDNTQRIKFDNAWEIRFESRQKRRPAEAGRITGRLLNLIHTGNQKIAS